MKVPENGQAINLHTLVAVGVNADGYREIVGLDFASAEDGSGWLSFFRGQVARGWSGVTLVTCDVLARSITPKSSWPWVNPYCTRPTANRN